VHPLRYGPLQQDSTHAVFAPPGHRPGKAGTAEAGMHNVAARFGVGTSTGTVQRIKAEMAA
jgi:hypothetical protein